MQVCRESVDAAAAVPKASDGVLTLQRCMAFPLAGPVRV
jgi:hypothetical protein